jgi:hypothetical protein
MSKTQLRAIYGAKDDLARLEALRASVGSTKQTGINRLRLVGQKRAISWLPFQCTSPVSAVSIRGSVSSPLSAVSVSHIALTTVFPRLGAGN